MWASLAWWIDECGFRSESLNRENNLVHQRSSNYFNLINFYIKHFLKLLHNNFLLYVYLTSKIFKTNFDIYNLISFTFKVT